MAIKAAQRSKPRRRTKASRKASPRPSYLKRTHSAVRSHLRAATDLPTFLASAGELNPAQRRRLVEQALLLIDDNYVHLPLKEAMHGVDPVQRLRLVLHRLEEGGAEPHRTEFAFHREMLEIFNSVRDLHTNYLLPAPFGDKVAFLPFGVEEYFDDGEPHYIASHFLEGFSHAHFKAGVEITLWNGVPIRRAIDVSAAEHAGSNLAARHARGIDGLTIRPLRLALPPDAHWVVVGYIDRDGNERETKQEWLVSPPLPEFNAVDPNAVTPSATSLGLDLELDFVRRIKKMLFAPTVVAAESRTPTKKTLERRAAAGESITTTMPGTFRAESVDTPSGVFGYVRIFTFDVDEPQDFIDEFVRVIELLPQEGLIVDVRGNGGGHIWASEGLLQTLTPATIEPEPVQFINTPLNLRIARRHKDNPVGIDLGPWADSIAESVETGAVYSRAFPITPKEFANAWGQKYHGPVVLVTDARCYSATDIFAAGFQDHRIGQILGADDNTGAGGANVWTHDLLRLLLTEPSPADPETPYRNLPQGAGMRVSVRQTLRVGERAGTPVEDLGVRPDVRYFMTRDDLLNGNRDLIARAAEMLSGQTKRRLDVELSGSGSTRALHVATLGLSRIDLYLDGRPVMTVDVADGTTDISLDASGAEVLELAGYEGRELVAARKLQLS
jgi:C-terminal processing protease CtpA/Prc